MNFTFEYGIGVPSPTDVVYDGESKTFKIREDANMRPPRFALVSADLKLKLYFAVSDRSLCGLEYSSGAMEGLPEEEISLPLTTDGVVTVAPKVRLREGITYVAFPKTDCRIDKKLDAVLISLGKGKPQSCFKIAKNLILGVDEAAKFHSFYILL